MSGLNYLPSESLRAVSEIPLGVSRRTTGDMMRLETGFRLRETEDREKCKQGEMNKNREDVQEESCLPKTALKTQP